MIRGELVDLQGKEFVVHIFVATDGIDATNDRKYLLGLWDRCLERFNMSNEIPGFEPNPKDSSALSEPAGVLAARRSPGPGKHEAVLRRTHDAFCLTVLRSPALEQDLGWKKLDEEWSELVGEPTTGVLGSARIFQARLAAQYVQPTAENGLANAVSAHMAGVASDTAPAAWWKRGATTSNGFAVWEASDFGDGRADRRILVIAGSDQDAQLSAWTWTRGDPEMTPFARYLLHAAKLRYEFRVWDSGQTFRQLRRKVDEAVGDLLESITSAADEQRDPDQAELIATSSRLVRLQADELGLVQRLTRLREMRRTVEVTASNLAMLAPDKQSGGLFEDDSSLATWFGRQLDHDATYLEAARERARVVATLVDQLVQRGRQQRQERFNLGLTGIIGAILMSLAAIQSLVYPVPISPPVKPAVVSALGAVALLISLLVLRLAAPERRWALLLVLAGVGLLGASLGWIAVAAITDARHALAPPIVTWAWGAGGALLGIAAAVAITIRRGRVRP